MTGTRPLRTALLLFVGTAAMQLAWILALPPYAGIDEFDHAYRAAAVAHGQWVAEASDATRGTGAMVTVPGDIVTAAHPQCAALPYTKAVDCTPSRDLGHGMVSVASGAGRYNPVFYWLVGTPARPFHGDTALYVMRGMTALLSSLLIALAGWALAVWAQTAWPVRGLFVAATPVAIYSTPVVAPNGPEIAAAMAVWCALLGLARPGLTTRQQRMLLLAAAPGAVALATFRSLGPLWLGLIVVTSLIAIGRTRCLEIIRTIPGRVVAVFSVVAVALGLSGLWILSQKSYVIGTQSPPGNPFGKAALQLPLWLLQSIAAFPFRNQQAPAVVYMCWLFVGGLLLVTAWRRSSGRLRVSMAFVLLLSALIPYVITVSTYHTYGIDWQGRYGLAFSLGAAVVAGLCLERAEYRHRLEAPLLLTCLGAIVVAQTVSVVNVLVYERHHSPLAGTGAWHIAPYWLVGAFMVTGCLIWASGMRRESWTSIGKSSRTRSLPELEMAR